MEVTLYVQIKTMLFLRYPGYLIDKVSFGHLSGISIYEALYTFSVNESETSEDKFWEKLR